MRCDFYREIYSARLDSATSELETRALDAHLLVCPACRAWGAAATRVTTMARLAPADHVPDLTARIMAAVPAPGRRPVPVIRLGLVAVALAQLAIAVPALLGRDSGAPAHIAREQGSWALALAVGLVLAAWRPQRAGAVVPVVGVLVACLAVTTTLDVLGGRAAALGEAPHLLAAMGLALLWLTVVQDHRTLRAATGRARTRFTGTGAAQA